MAKWIDLTPELTKKGIKELKTGNTLRFNKDGKLTELKIKRNDGKKVWAQEIYSFTMEELEHTEAFKESQLNEIKGKIVEYHEKK